MKDLQQKFSNIESDQLLHHLIRYVAKEREENAFSCGSLVVPINDSNENPSLDEMASYAKKLIQLPVIQSADNLVIDPVKVHADIEIR